MAGVDSPTGNKAKTKTQRQPIRSSRVVDRDEKTNADWWKLRRFVDNPGRLVVVVVVVVGDRWD